MITDMHFWQEMQTLLNSATIVIDRPKGKPHPRYPELIYPFDYGYLAGTTSGDAEGIDVWIGTFENRTLSGILCTLDILKNDAEIKLLSGCSIKDIEIILAFNTTFIRYLYIPYPESTSCYI